MRTVGRSIAVFGMISCLLAAGCSRNQKTYRIGILSGLNFLAGAADGFKKGMAELGYVEGENVVYDLRKMDFDLEGYRGALEAFVAEKADLIFVFPTEAALEAKAMTGKSGIPVVFGVANIEGVNLVDSVREPGGNITGVRYPGPDLALKRFEVMRELAPRARRYWIAYQKGYPIVPSQLEAIRPSAAAAGVTLIEYPADGPADLKAKLAALSRLPDPGMDAILILAEPLIPNAEAFTALAAFAKARKIPLGGAPMVVGEHRSIFGVHIDPVATGRQASVLADKVLKGMPAGRIPVASAESYFSINPREAEAYGLKVSEGLMAQANEVAQ